jgi:hypothetical protein
MWESKHFDRRVIDNLLSSLSAVFAYILRICNVVKMRPHLVSHSHSGRFPPWDFSTLITRRALGSYYLEPRNCSGHLMPLGVLRLVFCSL